MNNFVTELSRTALKSVQQDIVFSLVETCSVEQHSMQHLYLFSSTGTIHQTIFITVKKTIFLRNRSKFF